MIQILCGDAGHKARCTALSGANGGASVAMASGPAFDKKVMRIDTLTFWGHGVYKVEEHAAFVASKNYVTAGTAVKAADKLRQYTIDFGTVGQLRNALVVLA